MKDCKTIHPMLALHADGALPPKDAARVEAHLAQCAEAREELEQHRKLRKVLTSLPDPSIPNDLHAKIMERLQVKPQPVKRPFLLPLPAWGFATAACLTLFLLHQNPELGRFDADKFKKSAPPAAPAEEQKAPQPFVAQKKKEVEVGKGSTSTSTNTATYSGMLDKEKDSSRSTDVSQAAGASQASDYAAPQPAAQEPRAKAAKKSKMAERRDEVSSFSMDTAAPAASAGPREDLRLKTNANSTKAAAPSSNFGLEAAMAPPAPTPVPTEGSMKTLSLSHQFTASTWSGLDAPVTVESAELITDPTVFMANWQALRPGEAPPAVDFTSQAVVFLQARGTTTGDGIKVSRLEEKEGQLVIHYEVTDTSTLLNVTKVLTNPWSMQVIPKPSKPVAFQKD